MLMYCRGKRGEKININEGGWNVAVGVEPKLIADA